LICETKMGPHLQSSDFKEKEAVLFGNLEIRRIVEAPHIYSALRKEQELLNQKTNAKPG
jgi:hypothetical protein